jgi:hypothetical protein
MVSRKLHIKSKLKLRLSLIAILFICILLFQWLANYPLMVESYYAKVFYPLVCRILHPVFNLFSFSVGDVLYVLIIIFSAYTLFRLIRLLVKKQFKNAGMLALGGLLCFQSGVLIFYLFWGMNYFRLPAGERLKLSDTSCTTADLKAVTAIMIDSANSCRALLTPGDLTQTNKIIFKTAIAAVSKLSADSINFRTYFPDVKSSLLTPLLNYIGTSGYYNPFTGEAQINAQMPVFNRPVVACHEMSHQMGYGAEDEADFAGFLAGIGSHDKLLRYSAYHLAVDEFMRAVYFRDSLANKTLKLRVSKAVHQDFVEERQYWQHYQSRLEVVSGLFYDKFLKVNNQPQGLATYNRMILLIMAKYKGQIHPK